MRKLSCLFMIICFVVACQLVPANHVIAGGKAFECSIAGTWITYKADGITVNGHATITPLDPTGKRFAMIIEQPMTIEKYYTNLQGIMIKTDKNLYEYTLNKFLFDADGNITTRVVVSGSTEFTDCYTRVASGAYEVYIYDSNGTPQYLTCVPSIGSAVRLELEVPCVP